MVERVQEASPEVVEALRRLLPELTPSSAPPDEEAVRRIVESEATALLVARGDEGRIVGTLTLAVFSIPSGVRAWIEDVVVGPEARGRGVGEELMRAALELARARGATTVELTSRPSRETANRLYRRLGFEQRETNVYRYEL